MKISRTGYKTASYEFLDELLWLSQPIAACAFARLFDLTKPLMIIPNLITYALLLAFFAAIVSINLFLLPFGCRTRVISGIRLQIAIQTEQARLINDLHKIFDDASRETTKPD